MSQDFVHKLIYDSTPNSCELEPIPTTLFKTFLDDIVPLVCRIVNESLLFGSAPQPQFKDSILTPLLKKEEEEEEEEEV